MERLTIDRGFFFNDTATTEIYTLSLHDALPISVVDSLAREVRPVAFAAAAALAKGYPADELWAAIGCPVTALKGDRDVFVRDDDLERLRAVVPHARTIVVPDCGHFATVEHPHAVLAATR